MRSCVGDDPEEMLDGEAKTVGAAAQSDGLGFPSDYEKDRVFPRFFDASFDISWSDTNLNLFSFGAHVSRELWKRNVVSTH